MRRQSIITVLGLALAGFLPACSGDAPQEPGTDEGALARAIVPNAARIAFQTRDKVISLGAKTKVRKALSAFKEWDEQAVTPRCNIAPATKMTFFDKNGDVVATGSYVCFKGTIKLEASGKETKVFFRPGDLAVLDEPVVPADVLFDVTKIEIKKGFGEDAKTAAVTEKRNLTKVLDALDTDAALLPFGPQRRCPPNHWVTFYRAHDDVARLTYVCGDQLPESGEVAATFWTPNRSGDNEGQYEAQGDVKLDARAIQLVFDDETSDRVP